MDTRTILMFAVVMATIIQGSFGWFNHGMPNMGGMQNKLGDHLQKWKKMAEEKKNNYPPAPFQNSNGSEDSDSDNAPGKDNKDNDDDDGSDDKHKQNNVHGKHHGEHDEDSSKESETSSESKDKDKNSKSKDSKKGSKDDDGDKDSKSKGSKNKSKDDDKDSKSKHSKNKSKYDDKDSKSNDSKNKSKDDDKDSKSKYSKNKSKDDDKNSKSKDSKNKSKDDDKDSKSKDSKNKSKDDDKDSNSKDSKNKSKDDDKGSKSKDSNNKSKDDDKDSKSKDSKNKSKDDDKDSKSKDSNNKSKDDDKGSKSKDSKNKSKDDDKDSKSKDSKNKSKDGDKDSKSKDSKNKSKNDDKGIKSKDSKNKSKDDNTNSKSKDSKNKSKDEDKDSKNKDSKNKNKDDDKGSKSKDSNNKSKDDDKDSMSKDSKNKSKDDDKGSKSKDSKSKSKDDDKDSKSKDSKNKSKDDDKESKSKDSKKGSKDGDKSSEDSQSSDSTNDKVDGGWTSWSAYGPCSKTCGTGSQSRTRTCSNPAPSNGGRDCVGDAEEEKSCNTQPCPVDGGWTSWSDYGSCSKTCGTGSQSRSRSCTNPEPANNGADCIGDTTEKRVCNVQECPVDGVWSSWSEYGTCSKTCATGSQTRSRTCSNPPPSNNGEDCVGEASEAQSCNTDPCPFEVDCDGQMMDATCESWNFEYDTCEFDLGHVTIKGVRVNKQLSSTDCRQDENWGFSSTAVWVDAGCRAEFELCLGVDGGWSTWSDYGSCSKSCGGGIQSRSRTCSNPSPSSNGADCIGNSVEQISCNKQPCPVDGGWSTWSDYGSCSKSCGGGMQSRSRTCSNPQPSNNGADCVGNRVEQIICGTLPCPVDGGWSDWSSYSPCSKSCGSGKQSRTRTCSNPPTANGGTECVGKSQEDIVCNQEQCPTAEVDGGWSSWSSYSPCSKSCGSGKQSRTRTCSNPHPSASGADCEGKAKEMRSCNDFPCPSGQDTMKPPYKKPKECHVSEPCCEKGQLKVNLGSRKLKVKTKREGALKGVKVGRFSRGDRNPCSQSVVITADFERIDNNSCFGCLQSPYCGRRMLKIDLELSNAGRSGWLFDVGDSQSNDGSGSDGSHQENNAEVVGQYPNITVFPSDKCSGLDRIMHIIDGSTSTVNTVTLYVSNEHIRVTNSDGLDYHVCSGCLFALNGQSDTGSNGGNERVHVGLNRVLAGMSRVGYGVCSATLTWACPWCD